MPQVSLKGSRRNWRLLIGFIVLAITVTAGLVYVVRGLQAQQAQQAKQAQQAQQVEALNTAMQKAGSLDHQRRYSDEQSALIAYVNTNPPIQDRIEPLMELGNLAYGQRKDSDAINYYQQAVQANGGKLTEIAAESIGQAAASAGNKAMALDYFKQALQLASADPAEKDNAVDLKATVQNLESSK